MILRIQGVWSLKDVSGGASNQKNQHLEMQSLKVLLERLERSTARAESADLPPHNQPEV